MIWRIAVATLFAAAACGGEGDLPRCGSDADCAAGTLCERPVSGEKGVCIAPFEVALTSPAAGAWVGAAGASVIAQATPASSRVQAPSELTLLVDGSVAGTLALQGDGSYRGTWVPGGGAAATAVLAARAAFPGGVVDSAQVPVKVDLVLPQLAVSGASCAPRCFRDSVLHVAATASDSNLAGVWASLDLDAFATEVQLAASGGEFGADLDLGAWPFPLLARPVTVRFLARDLAGNEKKVEQAVDATRVRWTYDAVLPVTSPAVMSDGTLVVSVGSANNQLRGIDGLTGAEKWALTVEASPGAARPLTSPPSIGNAAIYVGGTDNFAYAVKRDGSAVLNAACDGGGPIKGPPAVRTSGTETGLATSASGFLIAFNATKCAPSQLLSAFTAPPALDNAGSIYVSSDGATLWQLTFNGVGFSAPAWNSQVGSALEAPMALDSSGRVLTGSADASSSQLERTTSAGVAQVVKALGGTVTGSPIVLSNGDIMVGDGTKTLHRLSSSGSKIWTAEPVLDGVPGSPLALAGGDAAVIVPTQNGSVYAIGSQGTVLWSGALSTGSELREPNVFTPAGYKFSLVYFGGPLGKLYAVIVDGHLDPAAPWPKAFHDPANTSNAATPLQ